MIEKYEITDYLKDDKELQKAVIEEFLKENAELKAENEKLRTCLEMQRTDVTKQYIEKVNVERENYKLKSTLQEIKTISEEFIKNVSEDCINITPMFLVHKEILELITKAESEEV